MCILFKSSSCFRFHVSLLQVHTRRVRPHDQSIEHFDCTAQYSCCRKVVNTHIVVVRRSFHAACRATHLTICLQWTGLRVYCSRHCLAGGTSLEKSGQIAHDRWSLFSRHAPKLPVAVRDDVKRQIEDEQQRDETDVGGIRPECCDVGRCER